MGLDADCTLKHGSRESEGHAHLDSDHLLFRGGFRLKIPFADIATAEHCRRDLVLGLKDDTVATFTFADAKTAEAWALKIRYPRTLIDKLGVKPEHRVTVLGVKDESFDAALSARAGDVTHGRMRKNNDVIIFGAESVKALDRLAKLEAAIRREGMIWVVTPKGQSHINGNHVRAAAKAAGLVDVKVCSFSDSHSALKLMVPKARR